MLVIHFGTSKSQNDALGDSLEPRFALRPWRYADIIASSMPAPHHPRKWLDGVSDALCILPPRLRDYRPFASPAIRSRLRLPGTTRLRFALHGAQRVRLR